MFVIGNHEIESVGIQIHLHVINPKSAGECLNLLLRHKHAVEDHVLFAAFEYCKSHDFPMFLIFFPQFEPAHEIMYFWSSVN